MATTPSGFSSIIQACPNIQDSLDTTWQTGLGANDKMPVAEFLTSEENRRPIESMIIAGSNDVKTVELVFRQRRLESQALLNRSNPICTAAHTIGNNKATYTFDTTKNFQFSDSVKISDTTKSCGDLAEEVTKRIIELVNVADRYAATIITNEAAVLKGNWGADVPTGTGHGMVDSNDILRLDAWFSNGQTINPRVYSTLRNALDDSGATDGMFLAGGPALREYFQAAQAGCCASSGIDVGEMFAQYGYASAYDKRLRNALNDDAAFLAFVPGAVQVLSFYRAPANGNLWGVPSFQGANYAFSTVASPRLGKVAYDLTLADNCGTMNITLTGAVQVIGLPTNIFAAGDEYHGVTGVFGGWLNNCATASCSAGSPADWPSDYSPSSIGG